jgi:hypothetical protein
MSQSLSRRVDILVVVALAALSITWRVVGGATLTLYVALAASFLLVNITAIHVRRCVHGHLLLIYSVLALGAYTTRLASTLFGLNLSLVEDSYMIALLLALVTLHFGNENVRALLGVYTPLALLAGLLIGLGLRLQDPLKLLVLGLLDAVASSVLLVGEKGALLRFAKPLLLFTATYTLLAPDINGVALLLLAFLHVVRNVTMALGKLRASRAVLSFDLVIRPLVVYA